MGMAHAPELSVGILVVGIAPEERNSMRPAWRGKRLQTRAPRSLGKASGSDPQSPRQ